MCRVWHQHNTDTYKYNELCELFKILAVLVYQCLCSFRCLCLYLCFIAPYTHDLEWFLCNNIVWLFQGKSCDPPEQILHYIEGSWKKTNYCWVVWSQWTWKKSNLLNIGWQHSCQMYEFPGEKLSTLRFLIFFCWWFTMCFI